MSEVIRGFSDQPTTSRLNRSSTKARYSQPLSVHRYVMSDVQTRFGAVGVKFLAIRIAATLPGQIAADTDVEVNFGENACTVKKENAPELLSLIRWVVINMLRLDNTQTSFVRKKFSKRQKRKVANCNEDIMRSIFGIQS